MKKVILLALCGLSISSLFGQNRIIHQYDVMTDKDYYYMRNELLVSEDGKKGFNLSVHLKRKNNFITYDGISCKVFGDGSCHENDILIILFDDSSRVQYSMWNDFNCEGNAYFDFTHKALGSPITSQQYIVAEVNKPVKAIRLTNGRTFESYTKILNGADKYFFINCYKSILLQDIEKK